MDKKVCRMCGKTRDILNLMNISFKHEHLIEYHCRMSLEDKKSMPQKICFDCNCTITNFANFADTAKEIQIKLRLESEVVIVKAEVLPHVQYVFQDELDTEIEKPAAKKRKSNTAARLDQTKKAKKVVESLESDQQQSVASAEEEDCESSESDYQLYQPSFQTKKKAESPTRSKRVRGSNAQKTIEVARNLAKHEAIELEVEDKDKNEDGSIRSSACIQFDRKRWTDIRLSCFVCDLTVEGPSELKKHYAIHSSECLGYDKFKCDECGESEDSTIEEFHKFLNHVTSAHRPFLKFCCLICDAMFWNLGALNLHYQNNHDNAAFHHCLLCGQFFETSYYLDNHEARIHRVEECRDDVEIRTPLQTFGMVETLFAEELADDKATYSGEETIRIPQIDRCPNGTVSDEFKARFAGKTWSNFPMSCSQCHTQQPSVYQLSEHFRLKHEVKTRSFGCKLCPDNKSFLFMESYVNHTFTMHHEHLRHFCFICDAGFWNYKAMYFHFTTSHRKYRINICLFCEKYHKCSNDLKSHKDVHTAKAVNDAEFGTFTCSICQKSYARKTRLSAHVEQVHNSTRSYMCETCGVSFNSKASLINHSLVHQTAKPFSCDVCGEAFKDKYKLKSHKGIHTQDRKFSCEICGMRFRMKGTLKGHQMTHTGDRPFKCEHCEKAFAAKYDLLVHTRLHTGEYTHECEFCGEKYPSWSNYSKHMRGRHKVDPRSEKKKKYDALHKTISSSTTSAKDASSASNSTDGTVSTHCFK